MVMRRREALQAIGGAAAWSWAERVAFACQVAGSDEPEAGARQAREGGEIVPVPSNFRKLELPVTGPCDVALSDDGSLVVAAILYDNSLRAWEAATGRPLYKVKGDLSYHGVAISPDGTRVATRGEARVRKVGPHISRAEGSLIRIWDAGTGRMLDAFEPASPTAAFAFASRADKLLLLAVGEDGKLWIRDIEKRDNIPWRGREGTPGAADLKAKRITFSRDGRWVAGVGTWPVGTAPSPILKLWNIEEQHIDAVKLEDVEWPVDWIALSPEGRRLAVKYAVKRLGEAARVEKQDHLSLLDARTGTVVRHFDALPSSDRFSFFLAFSPDGTRLFSSSRIGPRPDDILRVWDVETGHPQRTYHGPPGNVHAIATLPDSRLRIASGGGEWDLFAEEGRVIDKQGHRNLTDPIKIWEADLPKPP